MDPIAVVLERRDLAIHDITFPAAKFQALKRTAMPINVREVAGHEEANLLTFPARHAYQHAVSRRLPQSFQCSSHVNKMRTYSQFVKGINPGGTCELPEIS